MLRAKGSCWLLVTSDFIFACGDPGNIEVPLPLGRITPTPVTPSTAVVVAEGTGPEERCTFEVLIPDVDARRTLLTAVGERLASTSEAPVNCRVHQGDSDSEDVYDVEVRLSHQALPHFELRGQATAGEATTLALTMTLSDEHAELEAACNSDELEIVGGAVWFPSFTCSNVRYNSNPSDCRLDGGAIFENCDR